MMNLFYHFDFKSYLRTDLLSHMSQDKLVDFGAVCNRLDIEVVILLSDIIFQNMQFDKAVVLVLAPVFLNTHFYNKLRMALSTKSFIALCDFEDSNFLKVS